MKSAFPYPLSQFSIMPDNTSILFGSVAYGFMPVRAMTALIDPICMGRHHARVVVSPATGFGSPNESLRISLRAAFAALVRLQWAAGVGEPSGSPVRDCRSSNPALRRPSRLEAGSGSYNANPEGIMTQFICRALSRLFPAFAVPVATVSTETEARAIAALLVTRGKRVCIHAADQGFAVEVVA